MKVTLRQKLIKELEKSEGLKDRPSKVAGGSAIFKGSKEIAQFHDDHEIDVRLTKKVIRSIGLSHPTDSDFHHHRSLNSEWMELRFTQEEHVAKVVRLFKLAVKQYP